MLSKVKKTINIKFSLKCVSVIIVLVMMFLCLPLNSYAAPPGGSYGQFLILSSYRGVQTEIEFSLYACSDDAGSNPKYAKAVTTSMNLMNNNYTNLGGDGEDYPSVYATQLVANGWYSFKVTKIDGVAVNPDDYNINEIGFYGNLPAYKARVSGLGLIDYMVFDVTPKKLPVTRVIVELGEIEDFSRYGSDEEPGTTVVLTNTATGEEYNIFLKQYQSKMIIDIPHGTYTVTCINPMDIKFENAEGKYGTVVANNTFTITEDYLEEYTDTDINAYVFINSKGTPPPGFSIIEEADNPMKIIVNGA